MRGGYGAANNFPKHAKSTSDWLDAIKLPQYKGALGHLKTYELRDLSATKLKELMPIEGHRRRMLLALSELIPEDDEPISPELSVVPEHVPRVCSTKFNSTSSLYIDSTIVKPCIDEIIFCVAVVLRDRIEEDQTAEVEGAGSECAWSSKFVDKPLFDQLASHDDEVSEDVIFQAMKSVYMIAEFSPECLVISLLYIERVRSASNLQLRYRNWQSVLLTAMIISQKVWDDKCLLNADFAMICTQYSVKDINRLEKMFLELIQYDMHITASLYTSYYFELRTLCEKAERPFSLKPLSEQQESALKLSLQARSRAMADDWRLSRKWVSADGDAFHTPWPQAIGE
ncbi:hypothetical protein AB1Y20_005989 [Prymnesium parvum]|uniref:Cyclin N-terminal domain-containing protein n=1 Tax=Prymnesium parvum TaxID=97485 RepID=A0AB34J0Y4_PRYPA